MKVYQRKAIKLAEECLSAIGIDKPFNQRQQLKQAHPQCSLYGEKRKKYLHDFNLSYSGHCYLPHPQPVCEVCKYLSAHTMRG